MLVIVAATAVCGPDGAMTFVEVEPFDPQATATMAQAVTASRTMPRTMGWTAAILNPRAAYGQRGCY